MQATTEGALVWASIRECPLRRGAERLGPDGRRCGRLRGRSEPTYRRVVALRWASTITRSRGSLPPSTSSHACGMRRATSSPPTKRDWTTPGWPDTGFISGIAAGRIPGELASTTIAASSDCTPYSYVLFAHDKNGLPSKPVTGRTLESTLPDCAVSPGRFCAVIRHTPGAVTSGRSQPMVSICSNDCSPRPTDRSGVSAWPEAL
jgi:hypothetical protein